MGVINVQHREAVDSSEGEFGPGSELTRDCERLVDVLLVVRQRLEGPRHGQPGVLAQDEIQVVSVPAPPLVLKGARSPGIGLSEGIGEEFLGGPQASAQNPDASVHGLRGNLQTLVEKRMINEYAAGNEKEVAQVARKPGSVLTQHADERRSNFVIAGGRIRPDDAEQLRPDPRPDIGSAYTATTVDLLEFQPESICVHQPIVTPPDLPSPPYEKVGSQVRPEP